MTLLVDGTAVADAICSYETSLSFAAPIMPLDDNDAGEGKDKRMPAGYIAGTVVAASITMFVLYVAFVRFRARRA